MALQTRSALVARPDLTSGLRTRLEICGAPGAWGWGFCRSPSCDRCRRHRARAWADEAVTAFEECGDGELLCVSIKLNPATDVIQMRSGLDRTRKAIRNMVARIRSKDYRGDDLRMIGAFTFDWIAGASIWQSNLHLLVDLVGLPGRKLRDRLDRRWPGRFTMSAVPRGDAGDIQAEVSQWLDFSHQAHWPSDRLLALHEAMHAARGFSMVRFHLRPFQEWVAAEEIEVEEDDALPTLVGRSSFNPFR